MISCAVCGRIAQHRPTDAGEPSTPIDWMVEYDGARRRVVCPTCVRANVRAVEGKLDTAWW